MPQHVDLPASHANARRRLARSPHPYHQQYFDLPHGSERFSRVPSASLQPAPGQNDHGSRPVTPGRTGHGSTNSDDSGTEADDEHFLKGLPAPKLRPHKGLRAVGGASSPLLSPALWEEDVATPRRSRQASALSSELSQDSVREAAQRLQQKRRIELVRRTTETLLLGSVGVMVCRGGDARHVLHLWRQGAYVLAMT